MAIGRSIISSNSIFVLIFCHFVFHQVLFVVAEREWEGFTEELLLRPLPDRKVLTHFHFDSKANIASSNGGRHLRLFPKAIYQLVQKFHLREMELSFTQGRWNYERWGGFDPISNNNAKPPGVELWAVFDAPQSQADALWKNLTHTLSGLFCASINFLDSSTSFSAPQWGFRTYSGSLRYGALPREAVCTENLTPWLKLLPCRDKAGLAELMDRPSIYRGFYHSQRLYLNSTEANSLELESGIQIEQTLTIVLHPGNQAAGRSYISDTSRQPSWSLSSIFGREVSGRCMLSTSSNVLFQLDRGLVSSLKNIIGESEISKLHNVFELSVVPDRVIRLSSSLNNEESSILYQYFINKHVEARAFDLALKWKLPVVWSSTQPPLYANRFLIGSGNERGAIVISLRSSEHIKSLIGTGDGDRCMLRVDVFQVVPWYVKVYYHTLQIHIDGQVQPVAEIIEKMHVSPSVDKVSPGVLELIMKFPCHIKTATLGLEFDKGFLHISEYPPDANQGFDIPSAVVSFPDFQSSFHANDSSQLPIISRLQKRNRALAYTEVLLVPLTTPDFSMPYNVITITCTVFSLYFGSMLNILRRRVAEEDRLLKERANKGSPLKRLIMKLSAKLMGKPLEPDQLSPSSSTSSTRKLMLKVILVALIAAAWQYYFR